MPTRHVSSLCHQDKHGYCKSPCDCQCHHRGRNSPQPPAASSVERAWLFCRRGDHHKCVVELVEGRCPCPCHERDKQERATG